MVRRDKDQEPALVSYIVPDITKWQERKSVEETMEMVGDSSMIGLLKRFQPLCDDVKDYLSNKLASYAIPTVFVPLLRMPLNPNGKIDKVAQDSHT